VAAGDLTGVEHDHPDLPLIGPDFNAATDEPGVQ
jgi:hypothetical protein